MNKFFDRLTGRNVFLRPFHESDITSEYISWLNDPDVVKYSNQRFIKHTKLSCRNYLKSFTNTSNRFISVRRLNDDSALGTMSAYVLMQHSTADIGILIGRKTEWGAGVGQEAWDLFVNWLLEFGGIRKVTAGTLSKNEAMIRIMKRSGMAREATLPKQEYFDGKYEDLLIFSKYNSGVCNII
jgi:ribosomal-protein-alanine N-acetyltransferase